MNEAYITYPLRLLKVQGHHEKFNDVVYCFPQKQTETPDLVIFFGGDVQDFLENMNSHRDNKNYVSWNLEKTAHLLQKLFTYSHILVVKPARMEIKTFSCYDNFVLSNKCGVPEHLPTSNALIHLDALINSVTKRLRTMSTAEKISTMEMLKNILEQEPESSEYPLISVNVPTVNLEHSDIKLIGFSKGCVVLNQFLYEFHYFKSSNIDVPIISRIKDMFWLDGGHNGGKNTWITSKPLLQSLASLGINIYVHVTPYQIEDDRRPWIKKEEKSFSDTLQKFKAPINRTVHFENVPANLTTHFNLLKVFYKSKE